MNAHGPKQQAFLPFYLFIFIYLLIYLRKPSDKRIKEKTRIVNLYISSFNLTELLKRTRITLEFLNLELNFKPLPHESPSAFLKAAALIVAYFRLPKPHHTHQIAQKYSNNRGYDKFVCLLILGTKDIWKSHKEFNVSRSQWDEAKLILAKIISSST